MTKPAPGSPGAVRPLERGHSLRPWSREKVKSLLAGPVKLADYMAKATSAGA